MKYQIGDHIQQAGGYAGIAYNGKTWVRYDCSVCAIAMGLSKPGQRISLSETGAKRLWARYFTFKPGMVIIRHNVEIHNKFIHDNTRRDPTTEDIMCVASLIRNKLIPAGSLQDHALTVLAKRIECKNCPLSSCMVMSIDRNFMKVTR